MDKELEFRKSTRSNEAAGACVEVALTTDAAFVRDSKRGDIGPVLAFSPMSWHTFISGIKSGEFDLA